MTGRTLEQVDADLATAEATLITVAADQVTDEANISSLQSDMTTAQGDVTGLATLGTAINALDPAVTALLTGGHGSYTAAVGGLQSSPNYTYVYRR